jgi:CBS domain-containing protein
MHAKGVSGVAVVGRQGDLVGHFGASDVRCLSAGVFHQLLAPVREFLLQVPRPPRCSGGGGGGAALEQAASAASAPLAGRVLCAQPTSTLGMLVTALVRQRVHRVYITDTDCAPVGVVTCTDVLDALGGRA